MAKQATQDNRQPHNRSEQPTMKDDATTHDDTPTQAPGIENEPSEPPVYPEPNG